MSEIFTSIGVDPGIVIILLIIAVLVLTGMLIYLYRIVKKIDEKYQLFMKGEEGRSLEKAFMRRFQQIEDMSDAQDKLTAQLKMLEAVQGRSLMKYGVIKYDAFEDVGGKLSFALAMLDETDTGFVLNAIHSKEDCFLYIKEVVNGESYIMLSDEEIQALRIARKYGDEEEAIREYNRLRQMARQ